MSDRWWFEIPSVEHPRLLAAAIDEADRLGVVIGRIAMGSGLRMLTAEEREEILSLAHGRAIGVFAYVSDRNSFEPLVDVGAGEQLRGEDAFAAALAEIREAAGLGFDGVLIGDVGLLAAAGEARQRGELGRLGLKSAAAIAPHNAATAALYDRLGATSINVASSATLDDLIAMRAALSSETSIDLYIESPVDLGAGLRYREVHRIVTALAPLSLKIGLRNAPPLYPYGQHLEPGAERSIREKVRRARLVLDQLHLQGQSVEGEAIATGTR